MHTTTFGAPLRSRFLVAVATTVLVTAGTVVALAGSASATTATWSITSGYGSIGGPSTQLYEIGVTGNPQLLMTVGGGSTSQGAQVDYEQQAIGSNGLPQPDQLWQFVPDNGNDDVYQGTWGELKSTSSGLCLNIYGEGTAAGTSLIQWPCTNQVNEEWEATQIASTVPGGGPAFEFQSEEAPGVYLGYDDAMCGSGNQPWVVTMSTNLGFCGSWHVQRIGGQPVTLPNAANTSMVIDSNNPNGNWLTQAVTEPVSSTSPTQAWYLQQVGTAEIHAQYYLGGQDLGQVSAPLYRFVQVTNNDWADAVCLEAPGSQPSLGSEVETYGCDPNSIDQPNQLWILAEQQGEPNDAGVVTSTFTGVNSGRFVVFNDAMLGANQTTMNYPVLSVSSTIVANTGSQLAMEDQNSTVDPAQTQLWTIGSPSTGSGSGSGSGGSGSPGPSCVGIACLLQ